MRSLALVLALTACRSGQAGNAPRVEVMPDCWLGPEVPIRGPKAAKVTLIRFWTTGCPHCRVTLPAIEDLRREFRASGLETIAIYHTRMPKPAGPDQVEANARELGYSGPLAADLGWTTLAAFGLAAETRKMTSATFLLDHEGRIRFMHPGPEFHRSSDPAHRDCERDFGELRSQIESLLSDSSRSG